MAGLLSTMRLKFHCVSPSSSIGDSAVTVAVLGPLSSKEISPKKSPGPIFLRGLPFTDTVAAPFMIRKNPRPDSPSRARTAPSRCLTCLALRASASTSFLESSEKIGTCESILTTFLSATSGSSLRNGPGRIVSEGRRLPARKV